MSQATRLYTPEVLALAVSLAEYPWDEDLPLIGTARSQSCGSTLRLGISLDPDRRIERIGLKISACAIGQAAAAIFARHAVGLATDEIAGAAGKMVRWVTADALPPQWPELALLEPARSLPGRHGAILLPWRAALSSLDPER